jgi:phage terminase large subunit GpA-like protein
MKWVWEETAKTFQPPKRQLVSEWADQNRYLTSSSSAEPGLFRTSRAAYQREIMDVIVDRKIETVVIMKSAQIGATELILNVLGYYISQDPCPIMCLQPTIEMGRSFSKDRLAPMLSSSPALQDKVKEPRSRDSENTVLHKKFPGGHLTITGANSASGLASRPIRILLIDECDRYPASAGSEGDPIALATKRTTTFWNRKIIMASTPTIDGLSRIQTAFESSDKRKYWVPCVHCEEFITLEWANVHWEEAQPDTAHYVCQSCGSIMEEKHKVQMLREGEWRAEEETGSIAGFHISELYSPWSTWASMAIGFDLARKHPEMLKTWVNTSLGEVWRDQGEEIEAEGLMKRRENYDADCIPDAVLVITAGVDVQGDRLEISVVGWGLDSQSFVIEHLAFWGETSQYDVWHEMDDYIQRRYERETLPSLSIACVAVDSGYQTQSVYNFVKVKQGRRIFAIKGQSQPGKPIAGRPTQSGRQRVQLFPAGVDTCKETVFSWLQIEEPGPGYIHFPSTVDEEYFKQLTSEKRAIKYIRGRKQVVWVPKRERNETLDCFNYSLVALHILQPDLERIANKTEPTEEETPTENKQPRDLVKERRSPRKKKSFVKDW